LSYVWPGGLGAAAVRVDQRVRGPRLMAAQRGDESTISVKRAGRKRAASRSRLMIEDHLMLRSVRNPCLSHEYVFAKSLNSCRSVALESLTRLKHAAESSFKAGDAEVATSLKHFRDVAFRM